MNNAKRLNGWAGFVFCVAVASAAFLTGCTTYVETPPTPVAYEPPPPEESPVIDVQATSDFYAPLNPYGRWVVVGSYGRCWCPNGVEAGWQPYCYGHWESTDAGWCWASNEPWGWATYHYGRWVNDPSCGWAWVPQTQWAPAWVTWREGGGYCGWAPLGVSARLGAGGVFSVGTVGPHAFVFVEEQHFLEPIRPTTVVFNETIVNKTVDITKIQVVNKTVVNIGPRTEVIQRATGRQIQTVPVNQLRHEQETAVVAKQPELKALHGGKQKAQAAEKQQNEKQKQQVDRKAAQKPATENKKAKAAQEHGQKAQVAEKQRVEKQKQQENRKAAQKAAAQKKKAKQAEVRRQKGQAAEKQRVEKQKQQENRKAAQKAAAQKKKAKPTEVHRTKDQ